MSIRGMKFWIIAIGLIFFIPLVILFVYTLTPFHRELVRELSVASEECTSLPEQVYRLALLSQGVSRIRSFIPQAMINRISPNPSTRFRRHWLLTYTLWDTWLRVTFTEKEHATLWCQVSGGGDHQTLADLSKALFNRSFTDLTLEETAKLVILSSSPGHYRDRPDALDARVKKLLSAYQ